MHCRSKPWVVAAAVILVSGAARSEESAQVGAMDFGSPIARETLDEHRGGESSFELNLQEIDGSVRDNTAYHTVNGSNRIGEGSFANASGFPVAVQNTGNNVLIQNSFIINLDVR